jgi:hypothetical protein
MPSPIIPLSPDDGAVSLTYNNAQWTGKTGWVGAWGIAGITSTYVHWMLGDGKNQGAWQDKVETIFVIDVLHTKKRKRN